MFNLQPGNFQLLGGGPAANYSIKLALSVNSATVIATLASLGAYQVIFNLDGSGNLPFGAAVWGNAELTPPGTYYNVTMWNAPNGGGTQVPFSDGQMAQTWVVGPSTPYAGVLFPDVIAYPYIQANIGVVGLPSNSPTGAGWALVSTGSNTSAWQTKAVYDVRDFAGADVGAQINACFATNGTGTVIIPTGTWPVSTQIVLNDGQYVVGAGSGGADGSLTGGTQLVPTVGFSASSIFEILPAERAISSVRHATAFYCSMKAPGRR